MAQPPDRSLPPRPLRIAHEDGSAVFLSTDGIVYRKYYDPNGVGYGSHPLDADQAKEYLERQSTPERIAQAWEQYDQAQEYNRQYEERVQKACADLAHASGAQLDPAQVRTLLRSRAGIELPDGSHLELRTPDQEPQWTHVDGTTRRETRISAQHAAALLDGQTLAELGYHAGAPAGKVRAARRAIERTLGIDRHR